MRISARARAAAVLALRCEADDACLSGDFTTEDAVDVDHFVISEVMTAVWGTGEHLSGDPEADVRDDCLEAALLLEEGWSPGDPVRRIGG